MEKERHYKVKEIWELAEVFAENPATGDQTFTLQEARINIARKIQIPFLMEARVLKIRKIFADKVVEVYKRRDL